MMVDKKVKNH